ncbi:family 85 glycoside hydrolase [Melampsora larici-populina 98AG31]|uniref:Family 85 glycoside hydrolase n=1 Tax=Melampsora larici-populina (strain 98AG31 / pathotype 3-4-7) TaxID=747676 RepID=F4S334_MELLP|nr:family 85 glycoside hydrolase [Melampsora larici-populina 98AG31]EGG00909.1 family 85 glycoside hydrolase [Melampsora larici-populina 98AG31]
MYYHWNLNSPNQTLSIISKLQETINSKPSKEERSSSINLGDDLLKSFGNKEKIRLENLKTNVYFGVDVFGRGCMYGGGFSSWKAIELIQNQYDFSIALFAPGWTWESHHLDPIRLKSKDWWKSWWEEERFQWVGISDLKAKQLENSFVDGCRISKEAKEKVLPQRGTSDSEFPQHLPISRFFNPWKRLPKLDLPDWFYTNYSLGSGGNGFWIEGSNSLGNQNTWTDMSFCFPKNDLSINEASRRENGNQPFVKRLGSLVWCENVEDVGWFGSGSIKIEDQDVEEDQFKGSVGLVWMNTLPVMINGGVECRMVWKSNEIESQENGSLGIVLDLDLMEKNDEKSDKKIGFECYECLIELIGLGIDLVKVKDIKVEKLKNGWNETSCKLIGNQSDLMYIKRFGIMVQSGKRFQHHLGEVAVWPISNSRRKEEEEIIEVEFDQVHQVLKWIHEPRSDLIVIQYLVYLVYESLNEIQHEIFLGSVRDGFLNVNRHEDQGMKRLYEFELGDYLIQSMIDQHQHQHQKKKWVVLKRVEIDGSLKVIKMIEI